MGEPVLTMSRSDNMSGALRRSAKYRGRARCDRPDPLLDQRPPRFDRIEIVRVGRQEAERCGRRFNQLANLPRLMGGQIIHDDDITVAQMAHEVTTHSVDEARPIHRAPVRRQREPLICADGTDHRQVVTPVHRPRFDQDCAAWQPRMRAAHRQIGRRFIEENQSPRVYRRTQLRNARRSAWTAARSNSAGRDRFFKHEPGALQRAQNVRPMHTRFGCGPPVVRARHFLRRLVRTLPTYATTRCRRASTGLRLSARALRFHCRGLGGPTRTGYSPRSQSAPPPRHTCPCCLRTRAPPVRVKIGYGFGMGAVDHDQIPNSSEFWG